ncbi:MAG: hypothetical protein IK078_02700, partial [Lachnospiraceae bacterium]|nr:hypothetical protein [Lachnospiraceae bacterium]
FDDIEKMMTAFSRESCRLVVIGQVNLTSYHTEKILENSSIIYLTEDKSADGIFKYQPVNHIIAQLMEKMLEAGVLSENGNGFRNASKQVRLIGLYSPARSLLQSSIAITMGQVLAKEENVLYLNLEPCSGMEYLLQREFSRDLADLLFYMTGHETEFIWRLKAMVERVGDIDMIPPVVSFPDIEEMDPDIIKRMLKKIMLETDYSVIIIDLSEVSGLLGILELCDEIICPYQEDGLAKAKVDQYERILSMLHLQEIEKKTKRCVLPTFSKLPREVSSLSKSELAEYIRREILTVR